MEATKKDYLSMTIFLYNLLLYLFFIPLIVYLRKGLLQRLGFIPNKIQERLTGKKVIWLHAASIGEVMGALTLIKQLNKELPEYTLLISTITITGKKEAEKLVDNVIFCPIDIKWAVKRAINTILPIMLIVLETELWPNLLDQAKKTNCKIMLANGRLSTRNIKRYLLIKPLMKKTLLNIDIFSMQSQDDANRIVSLGALQERVKVSGNCKFDLPVGASLAPAINEKHQIEYQELFNQLDIKQEEIIMVAGSTREGEEEILLQAFKSLQKEFPLLRLIIAPRHLKRLQEIEGIIKRMGFTSRRKSQPSVPCSLPLAYSFIPPIILLDTIGELKAVYTLSHICFVGGSLVPIGGHNILEPASLGKVVLFGKFIDNYKEPATLLLKKGGGIQVSSGVELSGAIKGLLKDPEEIKRRGELAKKMVESNQGASIKNVQLVKMVINM